MQLADLRIIRIKRRILSLPVPSSSSSLTMKEIFYIAEVDEDAAVEIIALAVMRELGLIPSPALQHGEGGIYEPTRIGPRLIAYSE